MSNKIADILSVAADMEAIFPVGDSLTDLVESFKEDELSEADLTFVTAASSNPSFESFRKRFHLDSGK